MNIAAHASVWVASGLLFTLSASSVALALDCPLDQEARSCPNEICPPGPPTCGPGRDTNVSNLVRRGPQPAWLASVAAPFHFQSTPAPDSYAFQEPLATVSVTFEEWFYDRSRVLRVRELPVLRVPLD